MEECHFAGWADGRPLMIMPAESFIHLSKADLGAIIAYLKTVPCSGSETPEKVYRPVGRILTGMGAFDSGMLATYLDHNQPFPTMPEVDNSVVHGQYLSRFCEICHGSELTGGQPSAPDSPPGPNLAPNGVLRGWTEGRFHHRDAHRDDAGWLRNRRRVHALGIDWQVGR